MKLTHPDLQFQIEFTETSIPVCAIESPTRWRDMQKEFCSQHQGGDGKWILSDNNTEIRINKSVELILNPIQLGHAEQLLFFIRISALSRLFLWAFKCFLYPINIGLAQSL